MDKPQYPTINDATLVPFRAIEVQLKQFPDLLDRIDCPYPPHIKTLLRRLTGEPVAVSATKLLESDDDLLAEISELYDELKRVGLQTNITDPKDKIAMLKTSADLLNKVVSLKERALNTREMSRFQKAVVELLEGVITPAQRSEFIEKMGNFVDLQD